MRKLGLMGCGAVADYGHIPAILATEGLKLYAVFDPDPVRAGAMRDKFGAERAFTDAEAFFSSGIEAVSVTSPAPFHKANVLLAAAHKLPVLCEKPLAMDVVEARGMIAAMKAAGAPLHTAFCYRYSPSALKIRELVRAGAIGKVGALRLIYNWGLHGKYETLPDGARVLNRRREGRMAEGGPLVDCGTHQIDLANFWLGSPVKAFSGHGAWIDGYEAPEHIWLHMDHDCGAHTVVEVGYAYCHNTKNHCSEFIYELVGTDGIIRYHREAGQFFLENAAGKQDFEYHHEKSFAGMYQEWSRFLNTGVGELLVDGEQGLRVVEIAREVTDRLIKRRKDITA